MQEIKIIFLLRFLYLETISYNIIEHKKYN